MSEHIVYLGGGTRKARTTHTCDLCLTAIKPGWTYSFANLIGEDGPFTQKAHLACEDVFNQWDPDDKDDFDASEYLADGYVWPTYDDAGNVIEMPNKTNCWRCTTCSRRGTYHDMSYGVCRQCSGSEKEGGK